MVMGLTTQEAIMINWLKGQWDKDTALIGLAVYGLGCMVFLGVV